MTEINPDWIEAFRDGWLTADAAGKTGQRIEAGLRAAAISHVTGEATA